VSGMYVCSILAHQFLITVIKTSLMPIFSKRLNYYHGPAASELRRVIAEANVGQSLDG
jgi:hypothetical protein